MLKDLGDASAAVYVISRIAGEGKDRRKIEGDYYLSKKEREDILYLDQTDIPSRARGRSCSCGCFVWPRGSRRQIDCHLGKAL